MARGFALNAEGSRDKKSFTVNDLSWVLNRFVESLTRRSSPLKARPTKDGKKVLIRPPEADLFLFRVYGKDAFIAFIHY